MRLFNRPSILLHSKY